MFWASINSLYTITLIEMKGCVTYVLTGDSCEHWSNNSTYRDRHSFTVNLYTVHDAFGGATPSTPYIPTKNVNPPFTTDTTMARFNRSTPVDSVLNSASENEDDDSFDSGSRKAPAIETTHNIHPTFVVFEKLYNWSDQVKYDKLKDEHISLQEIHNKRIDEHTSLQESHNDLVRSYYKISSDLNHYKWQHSVQVSSLCGYEDSSALAAISARRLF